MAVGRGLREGQEAMEAVKAVMAPRAIRPDATKQEGPLLQKKPAQEANKKRSEDLT